MKIGILGAGNIGATLARKLSAAGHTVLLANSRGPDTIADLAGEAGATAVPIAEAVKDVDVIIMSIPLGKIREHSFTSPTLTIDPVGDGYFRTTNFSNRGSLTPIRRSRLRRVVVWSLKIRSCTCTTPTS